MKTFKLQNIQLFFLGFLSFYPILKFNYSSIALIGFCLVTIIIAFSYKSISFKKDNYIEFLLLTGYFILLLISSFYSENTKEAIKRAIQLSPLLIVPFVLSFCKIYILRKTKQKILTLFVIANIVFTVIILLLFFLKTSELNESTFQFVFDYDKFQFLVNGKIKNNALFVHKAYFSMGFVICAIFCFQKIINTSSKKNSSFYFFLIGFIYFLLWIFYAFSFPNIIALFLSLIAVLCNQFNKKIFFKVMLLFSGVFFSFILIKTFDKDVRRGFNFIESVMNNKEYEVNDTRKEIYTTSINIFKSSKLSQRLFGFGIGDVQDKLNLDYNNRFTKRKFPNLLSYNEEFNDPYWFKNNIEVSKNMMVSIDGNLKADYVFENKNINKTSHTISTKLKLFQDGIYTFSVFSKGDKSNNIILRIGEIDQRAIFNLNKGKVVKTLNVINAAIDDYGEGWYRCSITVNLLKKEAATLIGLSNNDSDYRYKGNGDGLFLWGAQVEQGKLTGYKKNDFELLKKAVDKELNSHNNYIYFMLSTGLLGLIFFLIFLMTLFKKAFRDKDVLKLAFCIIISINFLTENILFRHWGLMFISLMLIVLFSEEKKIIEYKMKKR